MIILFLKFFDLLSASLYDKKIVFYILGFRRSISYKPCGFLWPSLPLLLIYECIYYFVM